MYGNNYKNETKPLSNFASWWVGSRLGLLLKIISQTVLKLIGTETLYQKSAITLASSEHFKFHPPTVITNEDYRFIVLEQLAAIDISPKNIIIEPAARNTAPAILCTSIVYHSDEDASSWWLRPTIGSKIRKIFVRR